TVQGVACGLLVISWAPASFVGAVILIAITGPAVVTIVMAGATDVAGAALAPTAVGLLNLCLGFGLFAGPLAAGWLRDLTGSFATSFALAMGALLVADLLALAGWPAFVRARHTLAL
ncbi:MAG: YbfB/YjiJ family MFS transporter, partial [Chloroflexi bacterium]|nr:YbfB/YjiJ family MFS transporter [Chloroflexota bacterium]